MTIRVLFRDRGHRAVALATEEHVLILKYSKTETTATRISAAGVLAADPQPQCMVEFVPRASAQLDDFRSLSSMTIYGTLGLVTIGADVFLCVVNSAQKVATIRPDENVYQISSVEFHCINRPDSDFHLGDQVNRYPTDGLDEDGFDHRHGQAALEHPCLALKKLLSGGSFYYSGDFDLGRRLQDRTPDSPSVALDSLDRGFLWNTFMIQPLVDFRSRLSEQKRAELDESRILTSAIRGFALSLTVPPASAPISTNFSGMASRITIISRLSCRRAGTRFNARGIDDDGNVANFVETETIYWAPTGLTFSYAQIRGSVPVFWEQTASFTPGQQKIQLTRSAEATQPAFDKHFAEMEESYGSVHVVNLLGDDKPGEQELTRRYTYHIRNSPLNNRSGEEKRQSTTHDFLRQTNYDFHAQTRGVGYDAAQSIRRWLQDDADAFVYFLAEEVDEPAATDRNGPRRGAKRPIPILQQEGVFRTNCLDCLDRTNVIQTTISQMALEEFVRHRGERRSAADFWVRHGTLWADNGDALSKIYAGTGALKSSFTRSGKMSLAGALADVRKSAARLYINNFEDKGRQNTIDMLLGRLLGQNPVHLFDPINDYVSSELARRAAEYTSNKIIRVFAGTFNLNGKQKGIQEDLSAWLCPHRDDKDASPEIVAVGFQEIVELSPQQIMSTDPNRRIAWESAVRDTLNRNSQETGDEEYVLLRGGQLVGASLSVFVKASILPHIKNVEGSLKKTGMSGMAGNKGAVAIRMDYANTSICLLTAHLAAGFANYEERNQDYWTISNGLRFQRNRGIEDHDTIIWLGDFNYRVGMSNERARQLIRNNDLGSLYENDQLHLQMMHGKTFPHYNEARITFLPTYKYNNGTDDYDTSEKARIPAWCDRILSKGDNLRQLDYNTAPLRFSDHRPVYALYQCSINVIDQRIKDDISAQLYQKRLRAIANGNAELPSQSSDSDLNDFESVEPGLPPASSEKRKWWLDGGMPAQARVGPPENGFEANPRRRGNPFTPTNEPDWIKVDRPQSSRPAAPPPRRTPATAQAPSIRGPGSPCRQLAPAPAPGNGTTKLHKARPAPNSDDEAPPPLPARASTFPTPQPNLAPATLRKPAPPSVPKKPLVLRTSSVSSTLSGASLAPAEISTDRTGDQAGPSSLSGRSMTASPAPSIASERSWTKIPAVQPSPPPTRRNGRSMTDSRRISSPGIAARPGSTRNTASGRIGKAGVLVGPMDGKSGKIPPRVPARNVDDADKAVMRMGGNGSAPPRGGVQVLQVGKPGGNGNIMDDTDGQDARGLDGYKALRPG